MARTTRKTLSQKRKGAIAGMTAAIAMTITPVAAQAAEMPTTSSRVSHSLPLVFPNSTVGVGSESAEHHRGFRGFKRFRGFRGRRGYRHRRGIRTGDVLAGVLILGGIAAVASAASKDRRERDYRDREVRYRDRDFDSRPRRGDARFDSGRGIDNAVRICVNEIERDVRVDSVDGVDRTGEGWRVTGALFNGEGFTCQIGSDGRISDIDYGASAFRSDVSEDFSERPVGEARAADGQWSADRYAQARRTTDTNAPAARTIEADAMPSYPGGPLPGDGEEIAVSDTAPAGEDDRYRTAEAPDFTS